MIEVKVMEALRTNDSSSGSHYEYKLWVSYGGTHWYVFKRWKQFVKLDEELRLTLTGINVDPLDVRDFSSEHHYHLPQLQQYMHYLSTLPTVQRSKTFRKFLASSAMQASNLIPESFMVTDENAPDTEEETVSFLAQSKSSCLRN